MSVQAPHYLLFSQSSEAPEPGRWRFVLRASDGSERLVADDVEPDTWGERLELLTVVRGLEALDRPSRVTVMTPSAYVREGIRYGLSEWRKNGWRWERFGQMIPVKNADLWRRMDRALRFHQVECRVLRFDAPHRAEPGGPVARDPAGGEASVLAAAGGQTKHPLRQVVDGCRHWLVRAFGRGDRTPRTCGEPWRRGLGLGNLVVLARISGPGGSELTDDPQEDRLQTA